MSGKDVDTLAFASWLVGFAQGVAALHLLLTAL